MEVVVSVLVVSALVVLLAVIVHVVQKTMRWVMGSPTAGTTNPTRRLGPPSRGSCGTPPAYGHLPGLADPIGALGSLSPDADLSSPSMSDSDLLGD